jgi:hypothetical protein
MNHWSDANLDPRIIISEEKIFKEFISKIYFSPPDPDVQLSRTI